MDKSPLEHLKAGLEMFGESATLADGLWKYATEMLRWNERVNLTAITNPIEVVDKHLLDSVAVLPEIEGAKAFLDLGAGAGMPGIPLALVRPHLTGTLVDTVGKKVAFMKSAIVHVGLAGRVRAEHLRAEGNPQKEKLLPVDPVISRAFMDVEPWLQLARHYVAPGGKVVAMIGQMPSEASLRTWSDSAGLKFESAREFKLPISKDPRGVAVFRA